MAGHDHRESLFTDAAEAAFWAELAGQFEVPEEHLPDPDLLPRIYRS
ncbi:hypothetical protein [Corynebacterium yudongzhengii]|nr:hypothetical protein [Corynebacterium yudongzhengii]